MLGGGNCQSGVPNGLGSRGIRCTLGDRMVLECIELPLPTLTSVVALMVL